MQFVFLVFTTLVSYAGIVDGYTDRLSANPGDSIQLYLNAGSRVAGSEVRLFDLSGKVVARYTMLVFPQTQSADRPYELGFGYKVTARIAVPDLRSGIYLWENRIPFVIKSRKPTVVVVYPSNTINAYSSVGGKSLYAYSSSGGISAQKVSFLRPLPLPRHAEAFFRWMHRQSFEADVGYIADVDLDDYKSLQRSKLVIIPGHSEYWTLQARKNFDRFVQEGNHAMILSGNTMWWQVRYSTARDQLICYKDVKADPIKSARLKTINWSEASLRYAIYSSTGTDFRNAGYGLKTDRGWDGYRVVRQSPLFEGTRLIPGSILSCPSDETDGAPLSSYDGGTPVIDQQTIPFYRVELVGFDLVSRGNKEGVATWIVFQASKSSGIVINTASTDWCSARGIGSNPDIRVITTNMISKLLRNENVFSPEEGSSLAN